MNLNLWYSLTLKIRSSKSALLINQLFTSSNNSILGALYFLSITIFLHVSLRSSVGYDRQRSICCAKLFYGTNVQYFLSRNLNNIYKSTSKSIEQPLFVYDLQSKK